MIGVYSYSVMTIVYNTLPELLCEMWESLRSQTFEGWELVLIDDASTDPATIAALNEIRVDPRVTFRRLAKNGGQAVARNAALELCCGDLVAILDSDDVALPEWLNCQVTYMGAHPDVVVCGCQIEFFNDGVILGRTSHPTVITPHVIQAQDARGNIWFINNPGAIYRRDAILALGGYNSALRRCEDIDLWMRAHWAGLVIHNQPDVLIRYRRGHQ